MRPSSSPWGWQDVRVEPAEHDTDAPVIGDVLDTFEARLDARNPLRLPSVSADAGMLGPYWLAAASLAGLSHLHRATTGQDSYSYGVAEDGGAIVAVVADGLGSRPVSQVGSTLIARLLCSSLARQPSDKVERAPEQAFHLALRRTGKQLRVLVPRFQEAELACTAVVCWISTGPAGRLLAAGRVGDCALFTLREQEYQTVFPHDEGPLNVVSDSLPREDAEAMDFARLELTHEQAIILASDGLAEDVFGSAKVRSWLAERWSRPSGSVRMIDSLRYRRRGSQDDRTAVVIWLDPLRAPGSASTRADGHETEPDLLYDQQP